MKIKELWFKNNRHKWELEKTEFSDFTLLVGASGVGKTQILNAIMKLKNISKGYAYNGVEWDFHFAVDYGENYRWMGEFEVIKEIEQQEFKEEEISGNGGFQKLPKLLNEKLYVDDNLVFEREESKLKYEKKEVPKISPHTSVLSLFTKEDRISPIKESFDRVIFLDYNLEKKDKIPVDSFRKTLDTFYKLNPSRIYGIIRDMNVSILLKFAFVYIHQEEIFKEILSDFKNIFQQVENVRFELLKKQDVYELQIKELGTDWISRSEISFGMFKTLMHIAEMKLLADSSVVLIDEFENSLGVNCIDVVAGNLVNPDRNLQYIITSHHPYIINNIGMRYWKLVMREGSKVFTKNAEQLKLGKSKHEAFKQLLNLEEFAEGIS